MSYGNIGKNAVKIDERDFYLVGQMILLSSDVTQHTHTVSNADTDIATATLAANNYTKVRAVVSGYVADAAASTPQLINLKIKDGATQEGQTYQVGSIAVATDASPFTLIADWTDATGGTLHFTQGAAAADANTSVIINSIEVFGIV